MKNYLLHFIFFIILNQPVICAAQVAALPAGVKDGINYNAGNTSVTLVLHAPGKNKVVVMGDFTNWAQAVMNKTPDGQKFWLTISGLTAGTEYAFQYLVDNTIRIADPYSEKILDQANDPYINDVSGFTVYPNLKAYPAGKTSGYVSVLQTGKAAYNWTAANYTRPPQNQLLVYELLVRDFVSTHSWKTLKDTLNYLQKLGINAIELMPFNEFDGNNSWGYNPNFYNAPDKYYGTDTDIKAFIDECHKRNIAVIQDIVFNHAWGSCPLAQLYWDAANSRPAANNPWFNTVAPHPYGFGNDFNFSSTATRYFFQRILEYWLTEYKIDGFRFDLSKGFTNKNTGSDVAAWGRYDAERVANINWLADITWNKTPGSYVILEHLGDWDEENAYMNYKQGMMPWHRLDVPFNEATMGWTGCKQDISAAYYKHNNNFSRPLRMGNIESHDEERLMYKNLTYGNATNASYKANNLQNALKRMQAAAAFDLLLPGPKMIWQFGELGYDYSINACSNGQLGSGDQCRTAKKPIRWDYFQNADRKLLYNVMSAIMKLKKKYPNVFLTDLNAGYDLGCNSFKFYQVSNTDLNVTVVGNFDVVAQTKTISFQKAGSWTEYISGTTLNVSSASQSITLQPGEFKIFLDRNITMTNIDAPVVKNFSVYFKKPADWTSAKIHFWNSVPAGSAPESIWPGSTMVKDCIDWYRWDFVNINSINIVFNDGAGKKTADLNNVSGTGYYNNGWLAGEPANRCTTIKLHFKRPASWTNTPKVYYWNPTPANVPVTWPGLTMTDEGNGWWVYTLAGSNCSNIIFNNNGSPQTADLLNVCGEKWYDNGFVSAPAASRPVAGNAINSTAAVSCRLFPNPVKDELSVVLQLNKRSNFSIRVYDLTGRIMYKGAEQMLPAGDQTIKIRRNDLPQGLYMVETRTGNSTQRSTVMFQ